MEEKFDEEFKRKVKGINPEIPDVVKLRINDTLASLPIKRSWRKLGYLSAVAALFLVCFVGIKYIYPLQSAKNAAPQSAANFTAAADSAAKEKSDMGIKNSPMENSEDNNKSADNNTGSSPNTSLKTFGSSQSERASSPSKGTIAGIAPDTSKVEFSLNGNDGKTAADQGIQLILKTAIYDGKEIRIEFDKNSASSKTFADSTAKDKDTTSNIAADITAKSLMVNAAAQYDVRIVVNDIPLKCSINVIETPKGENQYSGTMIIIPDSGLPENFDMILDFDKIGEVSGQWLLTAHVSK